MTNISTVKKSADTTNIDRHSLIKAVLNNFILYITLRKVKRFTQIICMVIIFVFGCLDAVCYITPDYFQNHCLLPAVIVITFFLWSSWEEL